MYIKSNALIVESADVLPPKKAATPLLSATIQSLFQQGFQNYAATHSLPLHYHKVAHHIMDCRTAALGGHSLYCEQGHLEGVWYNSCKDRCCPQCQGIGLMRWVDAQKERLLDCTHHHITFTIPHEYQTYWRLNTAILMNVLFSAVQETLMDFLYTDPEKRHLDALPGFILALHTWGRDISLHPHIHCIITDGGINSAGEWVSPKGSCFLPIRAVMKKFRGKFNDFLRQAAKDPDFLFPSEENHQQLVNLTNILGRKKWNVYIKAGFKRTKPLLNYLVNYLKGGPLKNTQIVSVTETHITFRYYAHKDNPEGKKEKARTLRLSHAEFFTRYLVHIPPPRKPMVRQYGLYANGKTAALNSARVHCGQLPRDPATSRRFRTWDACLSSRIPLKKERTHCKICGEKLSVRKPLPFLRVFRKNQENTRAPPQRYVA
jgi:hypothetical protein